MGRIIPLVIATCFAISGCAELTTDLRKALIDRMRTAFDIAPSTELEAIEVGQSGSYTEFRVSSRTVGYPFERDLYVNRGTGEIFVFVSGLTVEKEAVREGRLALRMSQEDSPYLGDRSSTQTIVVFVDFQCEYCAEAIKLIEKHLNRLNLRLIFKHHPLPSHDWARIAAREGVCIAKQSNVDFWNFANFVFARQASVTPATINPMLNEYVRRTGIDVGLLESCMSSVEPDDVLLRDENLGDAMGVRATPTLFVSGHRIVGIADPDKFIQMLGNSQRTTAQRDDN